MKKSLLISAAIFSSILICCHPAYAEEPYQEGADGGINLEGADGPTGSSGGPVRGYSEYHGSDTLNSANEKGQEKLNDNFKEQIQKGYEEQKPAPPMNMSRWQNYRNHQQNDTGRGFGSGGGGVRGAQ